MIRKKGITVIPIAVLFMLYFYACDSGNASKLAAIPTDSIAIARGETAFNQHCGGCHNFRQDGIGPQLGGITGFVSADWILHFISDPQKIIDAGDKRAIQLTKRFKTTMPSFAFLTKDEMKGILAFLNVHQGQAAHSAKDHGAAVINPFPEPIAISNLQVELQLVTQIPASGTNGKLPLARITKLAAQPGTGTLFILDLRGKLYKLRTNKPELYLDMAILKPAFISEPGLATGFGSFAFHPDFSENGLLYTTHTELPVPGKKVNFGFADSIKAAVQWVLTEWKAGDPGAGAFSGKGRELLRVNMVSGVHGVQEITFNPNTKPGRPDYGLLYIGVGDGGSVESGYAFLAHSKSKVWGSILRIDPAGNNSSSGQYGIPAGNPFSKDDKKETVREIYAYGFRNPHRFTWTSKGVMLACNIGQKNIESVNLILPGHDYGWPIREGKFMLDPAGDMNKIYPLPANDSIFHITYPVAAYDHGEGEAISGGYEYKGSIPALIGKYIFGDITTGKLFYINITDIANGKLAPIKEWKSTVNGVAKTLRELCGAQRVDLHFGTDGKGELYILTKADGKVYKLSGAAVKPAKLINQN